MRRVLAVSLMVSGGLAMASPWALRGFDHASQRILLASTPALVSHSRLRGSKTAAPLSAPTVRSTPKVGMVVARLSVPRLKINAAVVQGTQESQLLIAPGHFIGSVLPGQDGLSVIAAHNATYFRQINALKAGNHIVVATVQGRFVYEVTDHYVLGANQGLPNSATPTLALEACYPLNALFLTPNRYVVFAKLVASQLSPRALSQKTQTAWPYHPSILPAISSRYPLWLSQNNLPMGTLRYQPAAIGPKYASFLNGPLPLNLTAETIRLLEAIRYVSQNRQTLWLKTLDPGLSPATDAFWGASSVSFLGFTNLVIQFDQQAQPKTIQITNSDVQINGQSFRVTMTVGLSHDTMKVTGMRWKPNATPST